MRTRHSLPVLVPTLLATLIAAATLLAQVPRGAATPQEAVDVINKAAATKDVMAALPVISAGGLKQIANEGVTGVLMVLAFSDPDDRMPGAPTPPKAELEQKRKQYQDALKMATGVLKPYGLDTLIGKPVLADATQNSLNATLDKADNFALVSSLYAALTKMAPLLGMKENPKPDALVNLGTVSGYKITGDKATAQNGAEMISFTRTGGRWYIEPPASKSGAMASTPSAPAAQAQPAVRATATGKDPEVVVGGIQVARVAASNDDFSARPFNSENGTKLVLWVKMPSGQGLIELDEDASVLGNFADDTGTNLGGKFGSFPEEFKDASGGTIDIASSGMPASGATSLLAEGTLAMTVASSTRKTRVPNVALKNDAKFMFDKTTVTLTEVAADGDSQTFTLNLPRQVMTGIKAIVFRDAKNQPIDGHRTSSGYFNNDGQMGFSVTTSAKTLTLEIESWQGMRTIKVPFKTKAGIGLN
jgi:hypothetical protein